MGIKIQCSTEKKRNDGWLELLVGSKNQGLDNLEFHPISVTTFSTLCVKTFTYLSLAGALHTTPP